MFVLLLSLAANSSFAQTTPPSQDDQLRTLLGLGDSFGCFSLLGLQGEARQNVDETLAALGPLIGNELRAICASSAVTSASSLGGALNTLQATKTVAQFRPVRRRIDQRLQDRQPSPPAKPGAPAREMLLAVLQGPSLSRSTLEPAQGFGVFGEMEAESRDRVTTRYESGYESDVTSLSAGLDFVAGAGIVGGWIGRIRQEAELRGGGVLIGSPFGTVNDPAFRRLVEDPSVLSAVCGGSPGLGGFEQEGTRFGAFAGLTGRGPAFVDGALSWSRRDHDYTRDVCAIENQGASELAFLEGRVHDDLDADGFFDPGEDRAAPGRGMLFDDINRNGQPEQGERVYDDIFAGTVSGLTRIHEFSASIRGGADFPAGNLVAGPRAILTVTRATTDAYAETGSSTVDTRVVSNPLSDPDQNELPPLVILRRLGEATGLELAYDEQSRRSILLETGGEVAYRIGTRFGAVVPHGSGYWRREFEDDLHLVTARMAQDLRATPARFTFANDGRDRDSILLAVGAGVLAGDRFAARVEFSRLASDDLFDAHIVTVQARVRF